ncbi:MAG: hypothetical protein V4613_09500 [Bacteroidota bacterium]
MRYFTCILFSLCVSCSDTKTNTVNNAVSNSNILSFEKSGLNSIEGAQSEKKINDIAYSIKMIAGEDIEKVYKGKLEANSMEYTNFTCFIMDIQLEDNSDIVNYPSPYFKTLNDKIQYLSFSIKDFIKVKSGTGEYNCINSTYERSYGQLPYSRFFLVFEKLPSSNITFTFNDMYFNNGIINFKI